MADTYMYLNPANILSNKFPGGKRVCPKVTKKSGIRLRYEKDECSTTFLLKTFEVCLKPYVRVIASTSVRCEIKNFVDEDAKKVCVRSVLKLSRYTSSVNILL